jgi:hypothetical protein
MTSFRRLLVGGDIHIFAVQDESVMFSSISMRCDFLVYMLLLVDTMVIILILDESGHMILHRSVSGEVVKRCLTR